MIYAEKNNGAEKNGGGDNDCDDDDNIRDMSDLAFAMDTIKNAMIFDKHRFGLEYDLDTYNVLTSKYFAIGAMENKGLNIYS